MSDVVTPLPKPKPSQDRAADAEAFAQAEKWMAVIREISQEQTKRATRS